MKSLVLAGITIVALAIGLSSCQKEDPMSPGNDSNNLNGQRNGVTTAVISAVPSSFNQKVLVEEFTSATSGMSPAGVVKISDITTTYPNQVISTSIHHNDAMALGWYDDLNAMFYNHTVNSAMINRQSSRGTCVQEMQDWEFLVKNLLSSKVNCGLAIRSEIIGNNAQIDVHAGFSSVVAGDLYLTVYLLEDQVTGSGPMYDQSNNFNLDVNHPFYNVGNPIQGFQHNKVLREVLTTGMGELIDPDLVKAGDSVLKKYFVNVSAYNQNKLSVVAFIHRAGATANDFQVLNVQNCAIGCVKNWN